MPVAIESAHDSTCSFVFVDDRAASKSCNGSDVLTFSEFVSHSATDKQIAVAIADPATRRSVVDRCLSRNLEFFDIRAQQTVVMYDVSVGEGILLSPFVTLTTNITIGKHFHANLYSYVEHDCIIGDFVTFAPGVRCNGNVHIGNGTYIGSGAILRQGQPGKPLVIGEGAVVGMGAVVTKDVPAGATVVGNPARILER